MDIESIWYMVGTLTVICILVAFFFFFSAAARDGKVADERERQKAELNKLNEFFNDVLNDAVDITLQHKKALLLKKKQMCHLNAYGVLVQDKWLKEVSYFIKEVIQSDMRFVKRFSALSAEDEEKARYFFSCIFSDSFYKEFERVVLFSLENNDQESVCGSYFDKNLTPLEFEHACADALIAYGWTAKQNGQSGDQGADVLAECFIKSQLYKTVLQCKLYSNPVGNSAVQQVFSAKQHYAADFAVVVSNQGYTRSAYELANTTGVILIHFDELSDLREILEKTI